MAKERLNNYDELPLVLDVSHIQHIMGISRVSAYELVHTSGFPAIRHGRLIKISKRAFFNWLEKDTEKEQIRNGVQAPTRMSGD